MLKKPEYVIPYGKQQITAEDIDAVTNVLRSDYLTQGPRVEEFENAFAEYVGAAHAVAVANGTAALHLSALALEVDSSSRVITTPITFSASANCVRYCGGEVIFADIDPDTWLLDIVAVKRLLGNSPEGSFAGIIPVDFAGRAVDLEAFRELADRHGLWILEDACHAPGGFFVNSEGQPHMCGSGTYADLSVFSFHPVKHIAAGEGGMITTNNRELYEKLKKLRTHGITREEQQFLNPAEVARGTDEVDQAAESGYPGWYMEMQELGYNYRLTDIQSALGLSQLKLADERLKRRREIASVYQQAFSGMDFVKRQAGVAEGHAYHLYILEVDDRAGLYRYLRDHNIYSQIHYVPVHLMPYYRKMGWKKGDLPLAERYYSRCISLPMFPSLTDEEQMYIIECVKRYYGA